MIPAKELAEIAVRALDDKKGKEIKLIRIDKITTLAEYFVICTGSSNTQINALCDEVEKRLTEAGEEHVCNDEARRSDSLEHLWADGEEIDLGAILPHAEEK